MDTMDVYYHNFVLISCCFGVKQCFFCRCLAFVNRSDVNDKKDQICPILSFNVYELIS